mmetsp:Transcript_599/g.1083  ORF Transcript_599/g.1083 Transcript_599/m.1083 type:complete len:83 (-) Transcript_599:64-312(-)
MEGENETLGRDTESGGQMHCYMSFPSFKPVGGSFGLNRMLMEFTQWRSFDSVKRSPSKTCPKCLDSRVEVIRVSIEMEVNSD